MIYDNPNQLTATRIAYKNPWWQVREDQVIRADGSAGMFAVVELGKGVSILPIDTDNNVILIREYNYAIARYSLEVAGGGVDLGEYELAAAKRELKEELGIEALEWLDLGLVEHCTSIMLASARTYLARGFDSTMLKPEAGVKIITMPLNKAVEKVIAGEITSSTTCCLLLKADRLIRNELTK